MRRSKSEIKTDLEKLNTLKEKLSEMNEWGESNWDMLSAQIQVLRYDLKMENVYKMWPDDLDTQGAAEDAVYWVDGGDVFSPFDRWCTEPRQKATKYTLSKSDLD